MKKILLIAVLLSVSFLGVRAQVTIGSNEAPTSTLDVKGSVAVPYRVVDNADVTLDDADHTVVITGKGETHINLPDPTTCKGRIYTVINASDSYLDYLVNGSYCLVWIFPQVGSTNTISKGLTHVLQSTGQSVNSDYGGWVVVNNVKSIDAWLLDGNNNGEEKKIGTRDAFDFPLIANGREALRAIWDGTNNVTRVAVSTSAAATVASSSSSSSVAQQLAKFTVSGGDANINGLTVGLGGGQIASNTAIGYQTLYNNSTGGNFNTAVGYRALSSNNAGLSNNAFGYQALTGNTSGGGNSAFGQNALSSNTIGSNNTGIGAYTLQGNTSGNNNIGIGYENLMNNRTGNNNISLGSISLYYNTTGGSNIGIGYQTLAFNVVGNNNVAIGTNSLQKNTGESNVAIGSSAALNTTTGSYNVAVGVNSLYANTTGANNTTLGYNAGYASTGGNNTLLGFSAGYNISSGANNTTLGYQAGYNITTGSKNIAIGASVTDMPSNTANNQMNIGNTIFGTGMTGTVASPAGNIGIGTNAPSTTLHVVKASSPALRIEDGTQASGYVLTSDASGNASWQRNALTQVLGTLPATGPTISTNNTMTYTGAYITLAPGKWIVCIGTNAGIGGTAAITTDVGLWFNAGLSDSNSSWTLTSDVVTTASGGYVGGALGRGMIKTIVSGSIVLNNSSTGNKTYYLWASREAVGGSSTLSWTNAFGNAYWERWFYATPVN